MTEQEKTSAVVEETREAVDTTSQPVATEKREEQYRIDSQRGGYRYCSGGGHRFVWLG